MHSSFHLARTTLLVLVLAAALAALVHVARSTGGSRSTEPRRETPELAAATDAAVLDGTSDAKPVALERRSEAAPPEATRTGVAPIVAAGLLADARSGLPLAGHTLVLAWHPTDDPPRKATVVTGAGGEFRFELEGEHWSLGRYYTAQVLDPSGRELFRGLLLLQSEISIAVTPRPVLAGRLVTKPPLDYESVLLRVWTPPAQALPTQLLCGETRLGPDGTFELPIDEPVPSDELLLVFADRTGGFADAPVPRMMIEAGIAPAIERELVDVEVAVRTSAGEPAAGAAVRIFPRGEAGAIRWNLLTADAEGRVRLRLQVGAYELCAGLAGHAPAVEGFELEAGLAARGFDVLLEPLGESDVVRGEVLAQDGTPVAGAVVTARPVSEHAELAQPGAVRARTDESGAFALAARRDRALVLSAEHPAHGHVELAPLVPADASVRIAFEPLGIVEVRPASAAADSPVSSGPMQYFLVERGGQRIESGYSNGCPWQIEGVVAGDYDVYLMAHGQGSYAEGAVVVPLRSVVTLDAGLTPSSFFEGRLVDAAGTPLAGLEVRFAHPYWPAPLVRAWSTVTSGMDGSFRVFAGNRTDGVVQVLRDGVELTSATAHAGASTTIVVP